MRSCWLATLALVPLGVAAQSVIRPAQRWETVRTDHFTIDFPAPSRAWSENVAQHLESIRAAVDAVVGSGPTHRVTVLIDDPYSDANGFTLPFLDAPTIVLFAVPPRPTFDIGNFRDWGTLLITHEYTHIAHLTRPSRNPLERVVARFGPVALSPIAARAPRWVVEGYATFVEGRLTGSGRPNGAARAATLRQFALEGRLPSYAELNGSGRFEGGAMAYLAGSAFLDWLVARHGDSTLPHLWRRLTARRARTFVEAFAGVYGAGPEQLYGRFTSELTVHAFAVAGALAAAGVDTGETVQRLSWYTGDPAVSLDGRLLAIPVRARGRATRIVVSTTAPWAGADSAVERARRRLLARDPEDVPAVRVGPPGRRVLAELVSVHNRGYDEPRFVRSDTLDPLVLLSRQEPRPDGAFRPDLFLWAARSGHVRRITHGAGVRDADPMPDGRSAVAVRCHDGVCDLVSVSLSTGAVRTLREGALTRTYDHPRVARDGRTVVAAVHDGTRWTVQVIGDSDRAIGPADGANRYDPAWTRDGTGVIVVSEAGGVHHLERIDLATGEVRLVAGETGLVSAPEPSDSVVYFLAAHAEGRVLQRARLSAARAVPALSLPDSLAPAVLPPVVQPTGPMATTTARRPYGVGARGYRVLPGGTIAPEGRFATLAVVSADPVGRLVATLQGALGDRGSWRGGALAAAWRGWPVQVDGAAFGVWDAPSYQSAGPFAPRAVDAEYHGAMLGATLPWGSSWHSDRYRLGLSAGRVGGGGRSLAFGEAATSIDLTTDDLIAGGNLGVRGSVGRTDGASWQRAVGEAAARVGTRALAVTGAFTAGATNAGAPVFERFMAGGVVPPLTDTALLSQRVAAPALPVGIAQGQYLLHYRATIEGAVPATLYVEGTTAGGAFREWHRVYGAELRLALPSLGFVRVPAIDALAGAGYSIDRPFKYKLRGYMMLRYTP